MGGGKIEGPILNLFNIIEGRFIRNELRGKCHSNVFNNKGMCMPSIFPFYEGVWKSDREISWDLIKNGHEECVIYCKDSLINLL